MKNKNKNMTITALDLMPRDASVLGMMGKSRVFRDRKRKQKKDVSGRKAKYKERD